MLTLAAADTLAAGASAATQVTSTVFGMELNAGVEVYKVLDQRQLAAVSGVGLRFIVDLEAGKPTTQLGKVLQVLQTLGCSLEIQHYRLQQTQEAKK